MLEGHLNICPRILAESPLRGYEFVGLVGPHSRARKSVGVQYWQELWSAADPGWQQNPPEIYALPPGPCNYLVGRDWTLIGMRDSDVDRLMRLGGQRFGYLYCSTACFECRACMPARIRVRDFRFTKSQRRTLRRNLDLEVTIGPVGYTPEKFSLLKKFIVSKFQTPTDHLVCENSRERYYLEFHLHHPAHTREVHYRHRGRLLGVSILDVGQVGIYSHYFFYDLSEKKRRLGIFSFLKEISWCQHLGHEHLYIGFLNPRSTRLGYKAQFAELEVLLPETGWTRWTPPGSGLEEL